MITIVIWLLRHKTFGPIFKLYLCYATIVMSFLILLFLYYCTRYFNRVQHSEVPIAQWNDSYEITEDEEEVNISADVNHEDGDDGDGDSVDGNHTNVTSEDDYDEDGGDRPPYEFRGDIPPNPHRGDIPPNPYRGICDCICHTFCGKHLPVPYNADHDDDCDCRLCVTDDEYSDYSETEH